MKAQDEHDKTMQGWIRPLSMSSIGIMPFEGAVEKIDPALLVRDLCRDRPTDVLEAIKKRYLRVSTQDLDVFLVPWKTLSSRGLSCC